MGDQREAWSLLSHNYQERVLSVIRFAEKRRLIVGSIKPGRVVDLGCGPLVDLLKELCIEPGIHPLAVDYSLPLLWMARRSGASLLAADGRRLPLLSSCVDTVLAINSILPEHRSEILATFGEITRVLKPGGRLVAVLPAFEMSLIAAQHWNIDVPIDCENRREFDTTGWQSYYTAEDIADLMKEFGFPAYRLSRMCFDSTAELQLVRQVYGASIPDDILTRFPLFEHFLVADRS